MKLKPETAEEITRLNEQGGEGKWERLQEYRLHNALTGHTFNIWEEVGGSRESMLLALAFQALIEIETLNAAYLKCKQNCSKPLQLVINKGKILEEQLYSPVKPYHPTEKSKLDKAKEWLCEVLGVEVK